MTGPDAVKNIENKTDRKKVLLILFKTPYPGTDMGSSYGHIETKTLIYYHKKSEIVVIIVGVIKNTISRGICKYVRYITDN